MPKAYRLIILAIFSFSLLQSKAEGKLVSGKDTSKSHSDTTTHLGDHILKPIIGVGTGVLAYYGNVKPSNSYLQSPLIGRLGYDLSFAMKMTPVVEFNLYALFGTVAVDERSPTLNWSFQSEIRGGGFHFLFKILPRQPVTPYVLVGFESFEFLSKVDLTNQYGQKYYYWSDGSIRNMAQTATNAASASILYQDYTYESDVRSMNLDGSGKYTEQTYAVPLGIGFMFKVGKKADFMIGTTLHYTFTDHIDGLTPDVSGPLKGTTYHDKFLFSSIMLRYDLTSAKNMRDETDKDEDRYEGVDFAALMNEDNDKDGVRDWDDSCAGTPSGAVVDKKGCPVDQDKDGVPDYRDKQEETPAGSIVNTDGVALTDSMMLRQYQMYVDSTGQFATVQIDSNGITGYHPKNTTTNTTATRYTVELGHYTKGVPADVMDKFLSVSDVKSNMMKDSSSVYTAGDYGDYNSAKARQEDLVKLGLTDAKVVYRKGDDFITAEAPVNNGTNPTNVTTTTNPENKTGTNPTNVTTTTNTENKTGTNPTKTGTNPENKTGTNPTNVTTTTNPENKAITNPSNGAIVYRVQLGAYRHKLSKNIYSDVSDIVEIKTENGFYTYSSGAFTNYQDAANHKAKLITQGFTDAFIKAYQNGKRIPLEKAGAIYVKPDKEDMSEQPSKEQITMDKSQVSFKVQVGAFKGTPPANLQAVYKLYSNLTTDRDENGITHYLVGPYSDYKSAKDMKAEAEASGAKGSFIVAYFKGKPIPVSEAMDILSK